MPDWKRRFGLAGIRATGALSPKDMVSRGVGLAKQIDAVYGQERRRGVSGGYGGGYVVTEPALPGVAQAMDLIVRRLEALEAGLDSASTEAGMNDRAKKADLVGGMVGARQLSGAASE